MKYNEIFGCVDHIVKEDAIIKFKCNEKEICQEIKVKTLSKIGADFEGAPLKVTVKEIKNAKNCIKFVVQIFYDYESEERMRKECKETKFTKRDKIIMESL